jgi:broad specificity phosphatase PhoE
MRVKHTEIFMVRHGQTDSNVSGLFHGATDVPLNAVGLRQAELVALRVSQLSELRSLHSSPLSRARTTAEAIARTTRLKPRLHPGLAEMHFGEAEGLALQVMAEQWPELAARFLDMDDHDARFPGGESRREFHHRVRVTLDTIVSEHTGERLLIVGHGGVIGSIVAQLLGENPNDWRRISVHNCSVTHHELASTGPVAHLLNDVVHLEELEVSQVEAPSR